MKVSKAQMHTNEVQTRHARDNVYDTATLLVAQIRLAGIDQWEMRRIAQVRAESERRRQEHRTDAGTAITRLQARGKSLQTIAALAGMSAAEVRTFLNCAPGQRVSKPEAVTIGTHALGDSTQEDRFGGLA